MSRLLSLLGLILFVAIPLLLVPAFMNDLGLIIFAISIRRNWIHLLFLFNCFQPKKIPNCLFGLKIERLNRLWWWGYFLGDRMGFFGWFVRLLCWGSRALSLWLKCSLNSFLYPKVSGLSLFWGWNLTLWKSHCSVFGQRLVEFGTSFSIDLETSYLRFVQVYLGRENH